ncbi:uncharacterized protein EDB91DRAFT_218203 [Suillus paluster]|uniref:uncharacterized protein n=1 Tax=Suillus paluster TaxID=48578 RepID=UPI001B869D98|nr:uncharacterized protein EDB91DRAFT_218203 [Suillus paluster]KAG1743623.1 hypothetical protein EDB91DRAFT_218203 [Suillus paluster]
MDSNKFKELVSRLFDEYIINEMPAHLLRLHPDKGPIETIELIDRFSLRSYYETKVDEIREDDIVPNADEEWEDAILRLIKEKIQYAILSHRWVDGDSETSFQYMKSKIEVKSLDSRVGGLGKLYAFCQKARDDFGCSFAWCDLCCIDKTSSSELDEAIRSMFRWYRNSHICITYLPETDSIDDLAKEEWFKRGWTLLELLAPFRLKFYGKLWAPLRPLHESKNDKCDNILQEISRITRIPEMDLRSFEPETNRVREKMLWASNRRTTKVEDIAYSLIGIFDVSLMVAYGEGKRAFYRLMEAILQRCDHWEIFCWKGVSSLYNAALPADPSCYHVVENTDDVHAEEQMNNERYIIGDKLFALTNHGLKIKVFLIRVEKVHETVVEGTHGSRKRLGFSHGVLGDVELTSVHSKYEAHAEWAFGVVDFWQQYGGELGFLDPHSRSRPYTAFLLSYHPNASPDARWRKEMTEDIVHIWPQRYIEDSLTLLYL